MTYYLWLHPTDDVFYWATYKSGGTKDYWCYYPLPDELRSICALWKCSYVEDEAMVSGVLADWIDDHRSELLSTAEGPSDPAERLDRLVTYLRSRFQSQFESTK